MSGAFSQGDVISYMEMCTAVGTSLQRGMNYRLPNAGSVFLMSRRPGAPYGDQVDEAGTTLIYEGHDHPKSDATPIPKNLDQPEKTSKGTLTQNGIFLEAVRRHKKGQDPAEKVRVFEKIKDGIWVYNGVFELFDTRTEKSGGRTVFKFILRLLQADEPYAAPSLAYPTDEDRIIPSSVKLAVWKRDQGMCRTCGAKSRLHFDHIIPFSKGGSSKDESNIQILCGRHNLQKRDRIE